MSGSLRHNMVSSGFVWCPRYFPLSYLLFRSLCRCLLLSSSFPLFFLLFSFSRSQLTSDRSILPHLSRRKSRRHAACRCKGCHAGDYEWNPIGLSWDGGPICVLMAGKMNCAVKSRTWREGDRLRRWSKLSWLLNICNLQGFFDFRSDIVNNPAFKHTVLNVDQFFRDFNV